MSDRLLEVEPPCLVLIVVLVLWLVGGVQI
jgi:hypothetical protein